MVIGVSADIFKVVVFAAGTDALLAVGGPGMARFAMAKEVLLELVHSRVGEQQGVIADRYHWPTGCKPMTLFLKEINKRSSSFV